jgi:hypothetical protein
MLLQGTKSGILGDIVRGFKGGKVDRPQCGYYSNSQTSKNATRKTFAICAVSTILASLYIVFRDKVLAVGQAGSNGWHQFPLDLLHEIMLLAVLLKGYCTCRIPGADNKSSELKLAQIGHLHNSIRGSGSWGA